MRLFLKLLMPVEYEAIPPEKTGDVTFISYPDPTPGMDEVWRMWEPSGLWRDSKCLGLNFINLMKRLGRDINEYSREASYSLNGEISEAYRKDLAGYPEAEVSGDLVKNGKNTFYEFSCNTNNTSVILINPEPEYLELKSLPCLPLGEWSIEVPGPEAIDYYTSGGYYILKSSDWSEMIDGLKVPEGLRKVEFKEGLMIGRWEGADRGPLNRRPWREKLDRLKDEIGKVLDSKSCIYKKESRIKNLIKNYYG